MKTTKIYNGSRTCAAGGGCSRCDEQEKIQSNVSGSEKCDNIFDRNIDRRIDL